MSLVLDALLKAQSQRSRGEVPRVTTGLHGLGGGPAPRPHATRPPWAWIGLAVVLTALGAWAVVSWRGSVGPVPTPAAAIRPPAQAEVMPAAGPTMVPPVSVVTVPRVAPPPAPAVSVVMAPRPARAAPGAPAAPAAAVAEPTASRPAPTQAVRSAVAAADRPPIPSRAGLPEALRQALPALAVSGMVYARDPAQRMVLINGELWRQGDTVAPGLVLEEIRAKDLVLRYQGQQRFSLSP